MESTTRSRTRGGIRGQILGVRWNQRPDLDCPTSAYAPVEEKMDGAVKLVEGHRRPLEEVMERQRHGGRPEEMTRGASKGWGPRAEEKTRSHG